MLSLKCLVGTDLKMERFMENHVHCIKVVLALSIFHSIVVRSVGWHELLVYEVIVRFIACREPDSARTYAVNRMQAMKSKSCAFLGLSLQRLSMLIHWAFKLQYKFVYHCADTIWHLPGISSARALHSCWVFGCTPGSDQASSAQASVWWSWWEMDAVGCLRRWICFAYLCPGYRPIWYRNCIYHLYWTRC